MSKPELAVDNSVEVSDLNWSAEDVKLGRLPSQLNSLLVRIRPLFKNWMEAEEKFKKNTYNLAVAVKRAYEVYQEQQGQGRIGFARLFDPSIPEEAKTRDLAGNGTYNRLNYLIDKVAAKADSDDDAESQRITVTEKRKRIRATWRKFLRSHGSGKITIDDVETLLRSMLAELWPEDVVEELVA